jgi:hypothetical protein
MCDELLARVPMERKLEVQPAQTVVMATSKSVTDSEDSQILIGQAPRVSANANVKDKAPTTATLRAGSWSPLETKAAPMSMLS